MLSLREHHHVGPLVLRRDGIHGYGATREALRVPKVRAAIVHSNAERVARERSPGIVEGHAFQGMIDSPRERRWSRAPDRDESLGIRRQRDVATAMSIPRPIRRRSPALSWRTECGPTAHSLAKQRSQSSGNAFTFAPTRPASSHCGPQRHSAPTRGRARARRTQWWPAPSRRGLSARTMVFSCERGGERGTLPLSQRLANAPSVGPRYLAAVTPRRQCTSSPLPPRRSERATPW